MMIDYGNIYTRQVAYDRRSARSEEKGLALKPSSHNSGVSEPMTTVFFLSCSRKARRDGFDRSL
jgi:hypothetical protein